MDLCQVDDGRLFNRSVQFVVLVNSTVDHSLYLPLAHSMSMSRSRRLQLILPVSCSNTAYCGVVLAIQVQFSVIQSRHDFQLECESMLYLAVN